MDDLISRQALCEYALNQKDKSVTPNDIMRFPSAQSDLDEWCPDCKEYDSKRHCCPRLNRVIRTMLKDSHVIPERKKGRWILSDDREWKTCSECGADVDVSMGYGVYVGVDAVSEMNFCPNCGADMRGEHDE